MLLPVLVEMVFRDSDRMDKSADDLVTQLTDHGLRVGARNHTRKYTTLIMDV